MAEMQAAYEATVDPNSPRPGVVVLLSEAGLGKTRLLQEFFHWLSTTKDGAGSAGYWPDVLAREGDNLRIDPDPGACNHLVPLPFLWWGVRLPDPGRHNQTLSLSVLASCADHLDPHIKPMQQTRRRVERGGELRRATGELIGDVLLEGLGLLLAPVGLAKAGVTFTKKLSELWSDHRADKRAPLSPAEINKENLRELSDRYLATFHALLDTHQGFDRPVPFVLVIDDAQWARQDPALLDLIDRLLAAANDKRWPLLLVVTHWETEWNADSPMREIIERHTAAGWRPIRLSPHPDLSACVSVAFPGVTREQMAAILDKVGGNPRLLDEILRWLAARPRLFVGRDLKQPMTPEGRTAVEAETFDLHRLVEQRLNAAPPEIRATLAVSGLQGMRFLTSLTEEVFRALHEAYPVRDAVARAEHPYSFVVRYGEAAAEFAQRVFHDVAVAALPDIADADAARAALAEAVRKRIESGLEGLLLAEFVDTLAVAAWVFEHDTNPAFRLLAARATVALVQLASVQGDNHTAHAAARRFESGRMDGRWRAEDFEIVPLISVLDALRVFEPPARLEQLALAILERSRSLALERRTEAASSDLALSLDGVGDVLIAQGKLDEADLLYREGLELRRRSALSLQTPEARRDLLASCDRIANIAKEQGKLDEAEALYREGLDVARSLPRYFQMADGRSAVSVFLDGMGDTAQRRGGLSEAETFYREGLELRRRLTLEFQTPKARRDLAVSLDRVGDMVRERDEFAEAETFYREGLGIARDLAREHQTSDARRDLAVSCNKVANMALRQGRLDEAEALYREGLDVTRMLAHELRTPQARNDFSASLNHIGDIARARDRLQDAETLYREGLELTRALADDLKTPEARRNLSVSYEKIANVVEAQKKFDEAKILYTEALISAAAYRQQQPCSDADRMVGLLAVKLWLMTHAVP